MKKILIICHPKLNEDSKINKPLVNSITNSNIDILDLYKQYPDFDVDINTEQTRLLNYDEIIFQYPMYWYDTPALLIQYLEKVFSYNYAYGEKYQLQGKALRVITTCGAEKKEFEQDGFNENQVNVFLEKYRLLTKFCNMKYKEPFVVYDTQHLTKEQLELLKLDYNGYLNS